MSGQPPYRDGNAGETDLQAYYKDILQELPASAKLVYKTLEYEGDLTQRQLAEETRLPQRTVRHAVSKLEAENVIEEDLYVPDARQQLYRINDPENAEYTEM